MNGVTTEQSCCVAESAATGDSRDEPFDETVRGGDAGLRSGSVVHSGTLASGEENHRFESESAPHCGVDRGVATSDGATTLHAALRALGSDPHGADVRYPTPVYRGPAFDRTDENVSRLGACGGRSALASGSPESERRSDRARRERAMRAR